MTDPLIRLDHLGRHDVALAGAKAANLGELTRVEGARVPPGFCVPTTVFTRFLAGASVDGLVDRLADADADADGDGIAAVSAEIRARMGRAEIPADLVSAIRDLAGAGDDDGRPRAWAIRSSATAEDLPTASFAGQHDSFLAVVGSTDVLDRIRSCWASLFTERAVRYRARNGVAHREVAIAVIVQQMVAPRASGVMFTADPVSGDRTVVAIEACLGLGEALVSGLVAPDVVRVRGGGGAAAGPPIVDPPRSSGDGDGDGPALVLTEDEAVRLAALGRRIEAHFGSPQDIEWCLADDEPRIVQTRPITTLFPIPPAADDEHHVFVSVGHQQMMTDAMRPLGLSMWQLTTPAPMSEAGGRLFVDVTGHLATESGRGALLEAFGRSDPLLRDALETVLGRDDASRPAEDGAAGSPRPDAPDVIDPDPALVAGLMAQTQASIDACAREITTRSGVELIDFVLDDLQELRRRLFDPRGRELYTAAMEATWWLDEHVEAWLGERGVADVLTRSVPDNVTSEMGLALLDVADVIRPHGDVVAFLRSTDDDGFLDQLDALPGGAATRAAIEGFLATYGMRCAGEIDITRPRWSEAPTTLLPLILSHVDSMEPGAAARRFEQGRREAMAKRREVLDRLRALPDGEQKALEAERRIDCVRTFIGFREYPKYGMVCRYALYKRALLAEASRLVDAGVLRERDDVFFLRMEELHDTVRTGRVDQQLVERRKADVVAFAALTPPRVITSDGEMRNGTRRGRDLPSGALGGLGVSTGTVEGRARVIADIGDADVEPGDIVVTRYTDPSWTPLFVSIAGLVTEVGGMMTHGAVVAREYGLPAVVGIDDATRRIPDGARIRIDGSAGYVELLD